MLESFIGFSIFIGVLVFIYFKVVKPQMDKKKEVTPVVPLVSVLKEEEGVYLGAGNPMGNGPRPLWKFAYPGSHYGKDIEVWYGNPPAKVFVVADGSVKIYGPGYSLWKPISDEIPKNLVIHAAGGDKSTRCIIKGNWK